MTETMVTLVGNVATGVEFRESPTGGVARFRFAVPARRWDRARADWTDGPTSFYTVWAWRALAANLAASVAVGEPLVVRGRLRVREEDKEGRRRTFVDIEAAAAGHDLTRGTAAFRRVTRTARVTPPQGEAVAGLLARAAVGPDAPRDPWSSSAEDPTARAAEPTTTPPTAFTGESPTEDAPRDPGGGAAGAEGDRTAPFAGSGEPPGGAAAESVLATDPGARTPAPRRRKTPARSS